MSDRGGKDDYSPDTKYPFDDSSIDEEATHRDQLAADAPQVVFPDVEKSEKLPTAYTANTAVPPEYSAEAQSPQVAEPFSPLYSGAPHSPFFGGQPNPIAGVLRHNTVNNPLRQNSPGHAGLQNTYPGDADGPASGEGTHQSGMTYGNVSTPYTPTEPKRDWSAGNATFETQQPPQFICGLRRRTFWILIIVAFFIVVGAAVGGGVGGALANQQTYDDSSSSNDNGGGADPAKTSSGSDSPTHTSNGGATPAPHQRFSFTVWEGQNYTGQSQVFYSAGGYELAFRGRSYDWEIYNYHAQHENVCSVSVCKGSDSLGWLGSSVRQSKGHLDEPKWGMDNIVIACGPIWAEPGCRGPAAMQTFARAPVLSAKKSKWVSHPAATRTPAPSGQTSTPTTFATKTTQA